MLITLIGKNIIYKLVLPRTAIGNYWVSDSNSRKILNIEGNGKNWQINKNQDIQILNSDELIKTKSTAKSNSCENLILKEYNIYEIVLNKTGETFAVYCSPLCENNFWHLVIKNANNIVIGSNAQSDIFYKNGLVADTHARIFLDKNRWKIQNLDKKYGTFVNYKTISNNVQNLSNGDVIFILGLKLVLIGNNIYINNPQNKVSFSGSKFKLQEHEKQIELDEQYDESENTEQLYSDEEYFFKAPRIINVIENEKIRIDAPPQLQEKNDMPFILTMGSSLTMGVMMITTMLSTISGRINGTASVRRNNCISFYNISNASWNAVDSNS